MIEKIRFLNKNQSQILHDINDLNIQINEVKNVLDMSNTAQNGIHLYFKNINDDKKNSIKNIISNLKPWRKGPFYLHFDNEDIFIDTEWKSYIKMQYLLDIFQKCNIKNPNNILDIGCNNGYYMLVLSLIFKDMNSIVGIDPIAHFYLQYIFICNFMQNALKPKISFELIGLDDIKTLNQKFDIILCLGVLYHRSDPIATLKKIKSAMNQNALLILETLIILENTENILAPYPSYAKMQNVFFIFTPKSLKNIALRAGFKECELLQYSFTDNFEQRSTEFANNSLGDFLESNKTIEGYAPACRGWFYLKS